MSRSHSPRPSPPQISSSFFPPALRSTMPKPAGANRRIYPRVPSRLSLERVTEELPVGTDQPADIGSDLSHSSTRLRRTPSHKSLLSLPTLARVKKQWEHPGPSGGTEPRRQTFSKTPSRSATEEIRVNKEFKDSCGICFEEAVKPNHTKCCGQLFCSQHLSDWLAGQGADGRCPTCLTPCLMDTDTIPLHTPAEPAAGCSSKRRSVNVGPIRLPPACSEPRSPSPESELCSPDESGSSSDSDSGDSDPEWHVVLASHQATSPVTLSAMMDSFGGLLRLFGLVLVLGALAS